MDLMCLVKRCQSGDREAFGILYETYFIPMREVVTYYIHDTDAVGDILHDGFLVAFASINSLKDASKVETWLTSIMKNLALQYLKKESGNKYVPLSEESVIDVEPEKDIHPTPELTWEELNSLINQLPDGYGKVFRLAVLDGLSHKEIGAMLGIAPHSSSSQLAHAKAMLRRIITKYQIEIGALSIAAVILLVWYGRSRQRNPISSNPVISKNRGEAFTDTVTHKVTYPDRVVNVKRIPQGQSYPVLELQENIVVVAAPEDSVSTPVNDSIVIPRNSILRGELIAKNVVPPIKLTETHKWSLSLACSGTHEHNAFSRYRIPDPTDVEGPAGEIEVTEKKRHYMPLVVGLSLNRTLTSRWSVETGLRYTFLRSDFISESTVQTKETEQLIHYIGLPMKFNYRLFTCGGLSMYGQGGGALDIPVYGIQTIREIFPESGYSTTGELRINAPIQWSVEGGIGIQYQLTPSLSIYSEPSFRYYINCGSDIKTIRQDKPFEFTIPVGLRFSW